MLKSADAIERWENALRVLEGMDEHTRTRHFDMGTWGDVTPCGTVACLAGHCSLDDWFRARGFASEPDARGYLNFSARPSEFFGRAGHLDIFMQSDLDYDGTVDAVKRHIARLRAGADPSLRACEEIVVGFDDDEPEEDE